MFKPFHYFKWLSCIQYFSHWKKRDESSGINAVQPLMMNRILSMRRINSIFNSAIQEEFFLSPHFDWLIVNNLSRAAGICPHWCSRCVSMPGCHGGDVLYQGSTNWPGPPGQPEGTLLTPPAPSSVAVNCREKLCRHISLSPPRRTDSRLVYTKTSGNGQGDKIIKPFLWKELWFSYRDATESEACVVDYLLFMYCLCFFVACSLE